MTDKELLKKARGMTPEEIEDMLLEEAEIEEPFNVIESIAPEYRDEVKKLLEEGRIDEFFSKLQHSKAIRREQD